MTLHTPPMHRPETRRVRTLLTLATLMALVAVTSGACGSGLDALDQSTASPVGAGGADPTPTSTTPAHSLSTDELVDTTITDVQAWYTDEFPQLYDREYSPLPADRIIAASPDNPPPACGPNPPGYRVVQGNAFYCSIDKFVAYDAVGLIPDLNEQFGPFAVAMVIAHEWGHVAQDQANQDGPTILMEQQADCFAGAWTKHVADGGSQTMDLAPGALEAAISGMLKFRDPVGQVSANDPMAHGSAFDRVRAFKDGFTTGPKVCTTYFDDPPPLFTNTFRDQAEYESGGNATYEEIEPFTVDDLNKWLGMQRTSFDPVNAEPVASDGTTTCDGRDLGPDQTNDAVFYCADDRTVRFDEPFLRQVGVDFGDFGISMLLGLQWAVAVERDDGMDDEQISEGTSLLARSCLVGAWAGSFFSDPPPYKRDLSLSPGDLDEALQVLLAYSSGAGAGSGPSGFDRVRAFQDGVVKGIDTCDLG